MNKPFSIISTALFCLLLTSLIFAQPKEYVAQIGNEYITAEEFVQRFELMPLVSKKRNIDSLKHELLYTLIGERLLAGEAAKQGFETRTQFTDIYTSLEKLLVRDALFNEEVEKKVKVGADELMDGIAKVNTNLKVNIVSSPDSADVFNFYNELQKGAKFDSIFKLTPEYQYQKEPIIVRYGDMGEKYVEDILFKLIPGKYSSPLRTKDGWFLFYMWDKITGAEKMDIQQMDSKAKQVIKGRKRRDIGIAYMATLLRSLKVSPDTLLFREAVLGIQSQLQPKDTVKNKKENDFLFLAERDINNIKTLLGVEELNKVFIPFKDKPSTLNDFINYFYHSEFKVKKSDLETIGKKVNFELHSFIEKEVLAREGYRKGLDKLPSVQRDLKMWRDSFLSQMYRNSEMKSITVTDDELLEHYNQLYKSNNTVTQVKIIEIVSEDLSVIEDALNKIRDGKDFKEVAQELSAVKLEEPEFFPVTERGELGRIAAGLKPGEVYGPLKADDKYSLFKLIDKKEAELNVPETFEQVKETLRSQILGKKLYNSLTKKTAELSSSANTVVNEKVLSNLKLTGINMFAYRFIGFGGRISAVPYSAPFYEWEKEAKDIQKILP